MGVAPFGLIRSKWSESEKESLNTTVLVNHSGEDCVGNTGQKSITGDTRSD